MDTVEWIARSPCWLAAAVRGFANYGLGLSGMPSVVPVAVPVRADLPPPRRMPSAKTAREP